MPELTAHAPTRKPRKVRLIAISVLIILVVLIIGTGYYIRALTQGISVAPPSVSYGIQALSTYLVSQKVFTYDYATAIIPYALFGYSAANVSNINVSLGFFFSPPPSQIYVLNWTDQCFNCGNVQAVLDSLTANLTNYGVFSKGGGVSVVSQQNLTTLPDNATLVILNGLLPDYMLTDNVSGRPLLSYLLSRGVTIIYIGGDFSRLVSSQSVVIPNPYNIPYLNTAPFNYVTTANSPSYYLNQTLFEFQGGERNGPITYEGVNGSTLIAFSNYLDRWPSASDAGSDIAKAIYEAFWIQMYTSSSTSISAPNPSNSVGSFSVSLNPYQLYNRSNGSNLTYQEVLSQLTRSYARAAITGTSPTGNVIYSMVYYKPSFSLGGLISIPPVVTPGQSFNGTITVFINSSTTIEPHFDIYQSSTLTPVASLPPLFSQHISPPQYSFIQNIDLKLKSGSYIVALDGLSGQNYANAYFTVPSANVTLSSYDFNTSTFVFLVTADGVPLSGINATISLDNQYTQQLILNNGMVTYVLPSGASVPTGIINFTLSLLSENVTYSLQHQSAQITINKQYIEFIFALLVVIIEITIIKAPARDDFYVDIASMPRPPAQDVKLRYNEVLAVFDKLNVSYKWRYMPLSKSDFRLAVSNNLRYNSMPIMLTYKNIDAILDQLVQRGYVVTMDDMYAPAAWLEQSKHDMEYLATFKKLRLYLTIHGYIMTDLDKSDAADIVTSLHNEKAYIVIYSKTSKFKNVPVYKNAKMYLAFMNGERMEDFKRAMYGSTTKEAEELKMYLSVGSIVLIDANGPEGVFT